MDTNRDMKPFSLPNNRFTLLNAELYNKQLMKHTIKEADTSRLGIEQGIRISCFTSGWHPGTQQSIVARPWTTLALLQPFHCL